MRFTDRALQRLSSEAGRAALLDDRSARSVVMASYGLDAAALGGVATAQVDSFRLGGIDDGAWPPDTAAPARSVRVDALWLGSVRVTTQPRARGRVDAVGAQHLRLDDIDDTIRAAAGVLPSGDALETARANELLRRIAAAAAHRDAAPQTLLETWFEKAGVSSVGALISLVGAAPAQQLQLSISAPAGVLPAVAIDCPVAVALMIRDHTDAAFGLLEAVHDAQAARWVLRRAGIEPGNVPALPQGKAVVACVVSSDWFDDADWRGANPGERITNAIAWLAREGIALIVVPP